MKLPIPDKATYTISEFATLKKVGYNTVKYWIKTGLIAGAFQQGDGGLVQKRRWRIPKEALAMTPPKRGRPFGDINKGGKMLAQARRGWEAEKRERINIFAQYMGLLEKHAALQGRYDQLQEDYELQGAHVKTITGSLEAELMNVEMATDTIKGLQIIVNNLNQLCREQQEELSKRSK